MIIKISYPLEYTMPFYLIMFIEHMYINGFVENIFNETGFTYVWLSQNIVNYGNVSNIILERLKDQYLQLWRDIYPSGKGTDYRIFKEIINLEPYLLLLNKNHRSIFTNYRTAKHRLPIEVGRWGNIPRSERKCYLCDDYVIGDEYHFLFECYFFRNKRCQYLPKYYYV